MIGLACVGCACESGHGRAPSARAVAPVSARMRPVDVRVRSRRRLMEVQVTMAGRADQDTRFEYSTHWFDANGMLIPSFSGCWFPEEIPGQGTAVIFEMAPSPDAVTLNLECREVFHDRQGRRLSRPLLLCINSDSNSK